MEQDTLREWEHKCIQEEAPECTASCPIHVDARQFIKEMGCGNREAAFKVLAKTMPFPGILARICDYPCESRCKRGEIDQPIAIGLLERNCVTTTAGKVKLQLLARREQRIAVLGGGLAGITAAWDLLKKGFKVTVFERGSRLGGCLWDYTEVLLPRTVIAEELALLEAMKADIRLDEPLDADLFEKVCREFDAVFIDRAATPETGLPLERNDEGLPLIDGATGATGWEGVYAGGGTRCGAAPYSPINEVFQGRKAALSIERYIQKAQMAAGRENDGPYKTRLFTNIAGMEALPKIQPTDALSGYSEAEAGAEAARCIQCQCLECVKVCEYLKHYGGYPKKYARQIFNNERIIYGAAHTKNQFVNSCSNCGLCKTVCPTGFHMGDLCLQARQTLHEQSLMPLSFHEFALQDMAYSSSGQFTLNRHQPGTENSAWLYFPSCQLCASSPFEVLASYRYLRDRLTGGVAISLGCCGAPAWWGGRKDLFCERLAAFRGEWERLGKPRVITACSSCQHVFRENLPELEVISLWKVIDENGLPDGSCAAAGTTVSIADPCSSSHDPATQGSVRSIVRSLGMTVAELPLHGQTAECCGYGGLMFNANPPLAQGVMQRRIAEGMAATGRHDYLAYCAQCRDNFAASGQRISHLIEQIFPAVAGGDPAARGWISWSVRRSNRTAVKQGILQEFGEKGELIVNSLEQIRLDMTPELRRKVDARRILEDDIRAVIQHAEESGQRLLNNKTGQYRACHKPANVTFWVDYSPAGDGGFMVHNAYCHRMNIVGVKP